MTAIDLTQLATEIRSQAAISARPDQCAALEAIADWLDTAARDQETLQSRLDIEVPDRATNGQIAEWDSYLQWLRDPYTCNVTTGSADTLAAVLAELNAERARSAEARMRMNCEFDCGNCNVCRLRATIHVIQRRLKECRQTGREARRWAAWFAAERDYLRGEVAKDYARIAEKQRRDNAFRERIIALADTAEKSSPDDWGVHYVYVSQLRAAIETPPPGE